MSLDYQNFFRLGLTSEDDALEEQMITTIRTAPETRSTSLNRVVFKVPTQGILTRDSQIAIQIQQPVGGTESNVGLNMVNGVLGCIKEFRMTIDGQELVRLENPSYLATNDLYSKNTPQLLTDRQQYMYGNSFRTVVDGTTGLEDLDDNYNLRQTNLGLSVKKYPVVAGDTNNRVYGIPLHQLGATFLKEKNLPLYMLKHRDVHITLDFHTDAREYVVADGGATATTALVNLEKCELITTHIILSEEVENAEIENLKLETFNFPMLENYAIKGTFTSPAVGVQGEELYRLNLQGRELHRILMVMRDPNLSQNNYMANQKVISLGDEELEFKQNGLNVFERPVNNSAMVYWLLSQHNQGRSLKLSNHSWVVNKDTSQRNQSTDDGFLAYRGRSHFLGLDVSNGNVEVNDMGALVQVPYGGGVRQSSAFEVIYKTTPRSASNPTQAIRNLEPIFYVECAKLLRIAPNKITITF
jgi:hypothetical protein